MSAPKKVSALTTVTSLVPADSFPVNSGGASPVSTRITYQALLNLLAVLYQPLATDLTTLATSNPSTVGLNFVKLVTPTVNVYPKIVATTGQVVMRTAAQILAELGAQAASGNLDTLSAFAATTLGGSLLTAANASGQVYLQAQGDSLQTVSQLTARQVATDLKSNGQLVPPRTTTGTTPALIAPDCSTTDVYQITALANAVTFNAPLNPVKGQRLIFQIKDGGMVARAFTWNSAYVAGTQALPTGTPGDTAKTTYADFIYNSMSSKWDLMNTTVALS